MTSHHELPFDVSRETRDRLDLHLSALKKWNPKINLVSKSTVEDAWNRHVLDSVQLWTLLKKDTGIWVDLGSGGGFPGVVIAILAAELAPGLSVILVESDARKCAFLRTVIREAGLMAKVATQRIETLDPLNADVLSARALSDLDQLLHFTDRHRSADGQALFPKGQSWKKEVEIARKTWQFSCIPHTSISDPQAVILDIGALTHV
ncbi:16S rRNA (guanine(527)-N(7))-methyltransferase RsmG [Salipiger sp.]|uniref:16S rRNA (guanine(527)-N(7))-methyltransferase RsmG n=1 Tax=Salipiger sp. TaxID=2078585 RepID=UPI003A97C799